MAPAAAVAAFPQRICKRVAERKRRLRTNAASDARSLLPALARLFMMNKPLTQDDNHDDVCLLIVQPHHLGFPPGRTGTNVPRLPRGASNGGAAAASPRRDFFAGP